MSRREPFANMTVNLGPVPLPFSGGTKLNGTGFACDPRCLRRVINSEINQAYANFSSIVTLITQTQDIWELEMITQGFPRSASTGLHKWGHYTIRGNLGSDPFASPGEPAFFLYHSMVDRVWWIWQNLDPAARTNAISGTGSLLNYTLSHNTTLDTVIDTDEHYW